MSIHAIFSHNISLSSVFSTKGEENRLICIATDSNGRILSSDLNEQYYSMFGIESLIYAHPKRSSRKFINNTEFLVINVGTEPLSSSLNYALLCDLNFNCRLAFLQYGNRVKLDFVLPDNLSFDELSQIISILGSYSEFYKVTLYNYPKEAHG